MCCLSSILLLLLLLKLLMWYKHWQILFPNVCIVLKTRVRIIPNPWSILLWIQGTAKMGFPKTRSIYFDEHIDHKSHFSICTTDSKSQVGWGLITETPPLTSIHNTRRNCLQRTASRARSATAEITTKFGPISHQAHASESNISTFQMTQWVVSRKTVKSPPSRRPTCIAMENEQRRLICFCFPQK